MTTNLFDISADLDTPVSAYLHSATMVKAGIFLLMRLYPVLGGGALLSENPLQLGCAVLLGWRGGYYLNRLLDNLSGGNEPPKSTRQCHICGAPYKRDFLERQGRYFCSYRCWFDSLKDQRRTARPLERGRHAAMNAEVRATGTAIRHIPDGHVAGHPYRLNRVVRIR